MRYNFIHATFSKAVGGALSSVICGRATLVTIGAMGYNWKELGNESLIHFLFNFNSEFSVHPFKILKIQ